MTKMEKELEVFNKKYPRETLQICDGEFCFRYYINPNSKKDITLVILVGGLGESDLAYKFFEYVAKDYSVLTFNYPYDYNTNEKMADALAELIKIKNIKNVWLFGQSYGGFFAQVMVKIHPQSVKGMILSNTGSLSESMGETEYIELQKMLNKARKFRKFDRILPIKLLMKISKNSIKRKCVTLNEEGKQFMIDSIDYLSKHSSGKTWYLMDGLILDLQNWIVMKEEDFIHLKNNVLLILSKDDETFSQDIKNSLIGLIKGAKVNSEVEGGHLGMLGNVSQFCDIIKDFIDHSK